MGKRAAAAFESLFFGWLLLVGVLPFESAFAQQYKVLYAFGANAADGFIPYGNIALDGAGNLYGTTTSGGVGGGGTVFRLAPDSTETVLHGFTGGSDGYTPAGIAVDGTGTVYGTTVRDGGPCQCGIAFRISPDGSEAILHVFAGGTDGAFPEGPVVLDAAGNLYGTTAFGGNLRCKSQGCGTIFSISPGGAETVLYAFKGGSNDGAYPYSNLVRDGSGNLYGTTEFGGGLCRGRGCGTVFELAANGRESILHAFDRRDAFPVSLVADDSGTLYGASNWARNGNRDCKGRNSFCGAVFALGQGGTFSILHVFDGADGLLPFGLFAMKSGKLYGTAIEGGARGLGTIFEIARGHGEKTLYSFAGGALGAYAGGGIVRDEKGNLLGTTQQGGDFRSCTVGCGVIFELKE